MKKKYIALICILSLFPLYGFFITKDLMHTHDGLVHLPRLGAFYKSLQDGQFPVRFAGDLNFGYGLPLFNFIYHFPYYVGSLFLFFGFGLVWSFKFSLAVSYIFSGIFMFLFAHSFFKDEKKAFLVSVFYQFSTFRFIELLLRGSFGEVFTYTFLPLVLYGLWHIEGKKHTRFEILTAIAVFFLILSHNSISLVFFGVCVLFALFFSSSVQQFLYRIGALLWGLLLASYYWIPAIFEHKYTYGDLFMKELFQNHFPWIHLFFIPNILNSEQFQIEHISVQIGIFHTVALIFSMYFLFVKKNHYKKLYVFCLLLFIGSMFFMQPISKFFWENISLLRQFQFPWRLLSVVTFVSSFAAVSYLSFSFFQKKVVYIILIGMVIFSSVSYWNSYLGYKKINEKYYWNFPLNTTYYGETDVIWSAGPAKKYPPQPVEIISGKGNITKYKKKSNKRTFQVNAYTPITVVSHTQYFPGWKAYVADKEVPIQFQDPNWRGELVFDIPKGNYEVLLVFGENRLRFFADMLSLSGVFSIGIYSMFLMKKKYEKK